MNYDGLGWGIGAVGLVIGLAGLIYAIYIERRASAHAEAVTKARDPR
jgi:F0F1-type ATP synthase membrane subunit c/vacuolar-type H+-ATPase subunit K